MEIHVDINSETEKQGDVRKSQEEECLEREISELINKKEETAENLMKFNEEMWKTAELCGMKKQRLLQVKVERQQTENKKDAALPPMLKDCSGETKIDASSAVRRSRRRLRNLTHPLDRPKLSNDEVKEAVKENIELRKQLQSMKVAEQLTAETQLRQLDGLRRKSSGPVQLREAMKRKQPRKLSVSDSHSDHTSALRKLYDSVTQKLNAGEVAAEMYQSCALTTAELEDVQSESRRRRPVKAAKKLVDIVLRQSRKVYDRFLQALRDTGQSELAMAIVQNSYRFFDEQFEHTATIRDHYVFLVNTMNVTVTQLADHLLANKVLTQAEFDDIKAEATPNAQNEKCLAVLSRKSKGEWELFLDALDESDQQHVKDRIIGGKEENKGRSEETELLTRLNLPSEVKGVAQLHNGIYVVCDNYPAIRVFAADTRETLRDIKVPSLKHPQDIVACAHTSCIYVAESTIASGLVWRVSESGDKVETWLQADSETGPFKPEALSVTDTRLLVTLRSTNNKLLQCGDDGKKIAQVVLPTYMEPLHAVESSVKRFVVCHTGWRVNNTQFSSVSEVDVHGTVVRKFRCSPEHSVPLGRPQHLARDAQGGLFLADSGTNCVLHLNSNLNPQGVIVCQSRVKRPWRLCHSSGPDCALLWVVSANDVGLLVFRMSKGHRIVYV